MSEYGRKEQTPLKNNKSEPDYKPGNHPDHRNPDQHWLSKEQSDGEKKITYVAHPKHVAELMNLPVVSCLRKEKYEWKGAEEPKSNIRVFN